MQEIKRHLKKRETQSTKKSGRSGSPSSESSCSVLTKEDNCLLDDRCPHEDPGLVYLGVSTRSLFIFSLFTDQRIQMTPHQLHLLQRSLPSPTQIASSRNILPAGRCRGKSTKRHLTVCSRLHAPCCFAAFPLFSAILHPSGLNPSCTFVSLFQFTSVCCATEAQDHVLARQEKSRQR